MSAALALALVLVAGAGPPAVEPGPLPQPPVPQVLALPDGTPVWWVPRPALPLLHIVINLPGGLSDAPDPAALALAAALYPEGPQGRAGGREGAASWAEDLEGEGARVQVGATALRTRVEVEALAGAEAPALDLAVQALVAPALPRRALRVARRAAVEDARTAWLTPGRLHDLAVQQSLYGPEHPLGRRAGARQIRGVGRSRAKAAWSGLLARGCASIVVVGGASATPLLQTLTRTLAPLPDRRGPCAPPGPLPAPISGPRRVLVDLPGASRATISALVPVAGVGDPDQPALELLSRALAADFDSRLSRSLREERGWTYAVHGGLRLWPGHGWLELRFTVDPEVVVPALALVQGELERLTRSPPAGAELARVRAGLRREAAAALWEDGLLAQTLSARQAWGQPPDAAGLELRAALELPEPALAQVAAALLVSQTTWVITGSRARIEPAMEAAGVPLDAVRSGPMGMDG